MARTLIRNLRIFDGTGADPFDGDVLIDGETFAAVGRGLAADGADVVDGGGRFAIPGLIDCHVHVTLFGEEGLETYARMGVTTVKDLGGKFEAVMDVLGKSRRGELPGARVLAVGAFVEGDPPAFGERNPLSGNDVGMEVHRTEEEVRATLDRDLAAGVDGIKLYAGLPPGLVRCAIDHIGDRVPVTGHLTATLASEAVAMGIGGLEHCQLTLYRDLATGEHQLGPDDRMANPGYWPKVRRGWAAIDPAGDAAKRLVGAMADAGTVMDPTLVLGGRTDLSFSAEEDAAFTARQRERMAARATGAQPPTPVELEASATPMIRLIEAMHRAGVLVTPGTDCGAVGVPPGYGFHIELSLLAQAMPARDVLANATSGAARWLRRDDLGTIAPGKRADIVLLDADPLADIRNARRISAVYMEGRPVPR
ncbi:MAG: amidohydrolase family protein [Dehalococcoidia bacterium]